MRIDNGHIYFLYTDHAIYISPRTEDLKMNLSDNFRFF